MAGHDDRRKEAVPVRGLANVYQGRPLAAHLGAVDARPRSASLPCPNWRVHIH